MSAETPLGAIAGAARAPTMVLPGSGLGRVSGRPDPRRDIIDRWGAALARGDDAEVDRLVRQSRIDRVWVVASEQLGVVPPGENDPAAPNVHR